MAFFFRTDMKKELLKLWYQYLDEIIDRVPVDNLPSGNGDTWREWAGRATTFYDFMDWVNKRSE